MSVRIMGTVLLGEFENHKLLTDKLQVDDVILTINDDSSLQYCDYYSVKAKYMDGIFILDKQFTDKLNYNGNVIIGKSKGDVKREKQFVQS